MFIQFVKFKSGLPEDDLFRKVDERIPKFREFPGLLQKYYVKNNQTGEVAGIYIWDSKESMGQFQ